jgi:hypothetical protein
LPYDPATPFLGIYPKNCKSAYSKGFCTPMFIAALFTTANLWKQTRCPTTGKWIKKMYQTHAARLHRALLELFE